MSVEIEMFTDASETSTSCPSAACIGQRVNITCDITGEYESIGWFRPDNLEVVTCLRNSGKCYINSPNYETVLVSDKKHILRIKKFSTRDSGTWNCRDGTNPLKKTCHVTAHEDLSDVASRLHVNCVPLRNEIFHVLDVCMGLSADPRVNVTLKLSSGEGTYDGLTGDVEAPLHGAAHEVNTTCSVVGPGTNCLEVSQRQRTAVCSRPGRPIARSNPHMHSTGHKDKPTLSGAVVIVGGVMLAVRAL
ncbi:uncharacterized protein [Haliotis asinina]|uniref:uncharacterized protein n=1 Tax=Haliotis asinina TaxID=109174 RepID=UPI00353205AD